MAALSQNTSTAAPETTLDSARAITAMPFEVSRRIGLASFKVRILGYFNQSARTQESYLASMADCQKIRISINEELRKIQKNDPISQPLKAIGALAFRIWESCAQLADFEKRDLASTSSELTSSEVSSADFLPLAINCEREKLKEALQQLAELIPPPVQASSPLLKGVRMAFATVGLFFGAEHCLNRYAEIDTPLPVRTTEDLNKIDSTSSADKNPQPLGVDIKDSGPITYNSKRSVRFLTDSIKADNLWMGDLYIRSQSGIFVRAQLSNSPNDKPPVAQVYDSRDEVRPGASVELLAPFGFSPCNVKVTNQNGSALSFTVAPNGHVVVGREHFKYTDASKRSFTVTYEITESTNAFSLPPAVSGITEIVRPTQQHDIITALRIDPTAVEEALDSVFREYLYVKG